MFIYKTTDLPVGCVVSMVVGEVLIGVLPKTNQKYDY